MPPVLSILFGAAFAVATAYSLGTLLLRKLPVPRPIVLAVGGAALSVIVFLTLLAGIAGPVAFAIIGGVSIAAALRTCRLPVEKSPTPVPRLLYPVFAAYGILYFVHGMAPEIQADAVGYHLGLVAEYLRTGSFPGRVGFYEMVPQGMEMLFLFAFAFGKHSAAKLVHLAFLFATVPLIAHTGKRLGIPGAAPLGAALIYLSAPVVGVTGASAYNDPALVFYALATLYLLLAWQQEGKQGYLLTAGVAAGFCYAVKFPGIVVLPAAGLAVLLVSRRARPVVAFSAAGLAMLAPWMLRNAVVAGNPVAPLFNAWFPNPYFHAAMDRTLAVTLASWGGVQWWRTPWELAIGGRLQGILGPVVLAMPLALLALRRRAGRILWLAAAVAALPWFWNMGTRFLLPAVPFMALALAMSLPRMLLWALVAVQVVACWPTFLREYAPRESWYLRGFPVRAALRLQPEADYVAYRLPEYQVARLVQEATGPKDRIFSLVPLAKAYLERETLEYWHSAEADQLLDAMRNAGLYVHDPFYDVQAEWPAQPLRGVRFRLTVAHPGEWCVHEVRLQLGEDRIWTSPQWTLRASPYPADIGAAFDGNMATRWRTWGPMRPGMFVEAVFNRPQVLSGVKLASHTPVYQVPMVFEGLAADGKWQVLGQPQAVLRPREDYRWAAAQAVRHAGYHYILAPTGPDGAGPLGNAIAADPPSWGMRVVAQIGSMYLFRVE
ncbi:MAG TPA: glycosyltransferase family 39 protein [Bryobacteraceae bacterium]|nr:glycosyltransferase family 39 protein [Bryobacteraceae bacterium]